MNIKAIVAILLGLPFLISAQTQFQLMVREAGAVLVQRNHEIVVKMVLSLEESDPIDIKKNDRILMINAQRIQSLEEFETIYLKAEKGAVIRLGIQRSGVMFISEFNKTAHKNSNQPQMISMTDEDAEALAATLGGGRISDANINNRNIRLIMELDMILIEDEGVHIKTILPTIIYTFADGHPQKGSRIRAVNGVEVNSLDTFDRAYRSVATGDELVLTCEHGETTHEYKTNKREPAQKARRE